MVCYDPGFVTPAKISKILHDHGINEQEIGRSITRRDVALILSETSLQKSGIMRC